MKFSLQDIECWVTLGVPDWERENSQKILVSIDFAFDTEKAEKSDNINDTVDYFEIYKDIKKIAERKPYKLLEKLHADFIQNISDNFPEISDLKIQIKKFPFSDAVVVMEN